MELEDVLDFLEENWPWLVALLVFTIFLIGIFWLRSRIRGHMCSSKARLDGKTVIVTGSNIGIGKETARDFYKRGAKVIMACRNMERAAEAARDIESTPNVKGQGQVTIRHLNLASFNSVREFAKETLAKETRIDILVNNAGLLAAKSMTEDGFDMVFQSNHLGHFLLTNLLLDRIKASAPSRIVNVSSTGHQWGRMEWNDLNLNKPGAFKAWKAYCQGKLANVLFTMELASKLKGTGVNVYSLHPGAVHTGFNRHNSDFIPGIWRIVVSAMEIFLFKNAMRGAQTSIHCAVCEKAARQTGLYYDDCKPVKPRRRARDIASAKMLWDVSAQMVKLEDKINAESAFSHL